MIPVVEQRSFIIEYETVPLHPCISTLLSASNVTVSTTITQIEHRDSKLVNGMY